MNKLYKKALKYAEKLDQESLIGNLTNLNRFNKRIKVEHQDGSTFLFENAFSDIDDKFLYVITEHCGNHVFFREDLDNIEVKNYARRTWKSDKK